MFFRGVARGFELLLGVDRIVTARELDSRGVAGTFRSVAHDGDSHFGAHTTCCRRWERKISNV